MERKANQTVILIRDNKRITVNPGEVFDFTETEVEELTTSNSNILSAEVTVDLSQADAAKTGKKPAADGGEGGAPKTSKKGGKKTAADGGEAGTDL